MISRILVLTFIYSFTLFAQYTKDDYELVRTTYLREFNKDIIYAYLSSKDSVKINAALLSIAHSQDTTFIDSIINVNYYLYGDYISFSLGQLGKSKNSTDYLLDKLQSNYFPFHNQTFNAIGKCGDSTTLKLLFELVDSNFILSSAGLPLAITNFYSRNISLNISRHKILENLNHNNCRPISGKKIIFYSKDSKEYHNSLPDISVYDNIPLHKLELTKPNNTFFALSRMGPTEEAIPELIKIAKDDYYIQTKLFVLNNFRKLKFFPDDFELFKKLISSDSWQIRTETANSACYYPFTSFDEISLYLTLLNDNNPNVSRAAAIALKNIELSKYSKQLKSEIENYLRSSTLTKNSKGELFVSYYSLFPDNLEDKTDEFEDKIEQKFIYRVLKDNLRDTEFNFDYLTDQIANSTEVELLDLLPAMLAIQNRYLNEDEYAAMLLKILNGDKPSSISIICDGLKLPFIHQYEGMLQEIIIDQAFRYKDNPQFVEALFSLSNLSSRINGVFHLTVLNILQKSSLYSIQKFSATELGEDFPIKKITTTFDEIWSNSFLFSEAKILTNKGEITISLKPEYAPITVGNFISLAKKGFYNGVSFHRVVPNFVIQAGDTSGTGWGGPGHEIVSEFSPLPFKKGEVGMASAGKDTEGSQWFIMHSDFPHLDSRYTNWATVISGMDVVSKIDEGDSILSIQLIE